ncbi:hypothetical protein [Nostoc sp. DedQUE02]|uniref:hypothetical protein n=1 Tax=Nostoc sp. DedQUE02 TaxID=3075388 RepID=UPI002AD453AF|nr:hypothetical protein [Nostoc sp. DedQUE03]MDZ7971586.1 hypothetical protein [Nostoc sp. DedQUE03]MDZ8046683.1 hypothetical protein [Nostoc sp. DedQUE02]
MTVADIALINIEIIPDLDAKFKLLPSPDFSEIEKNCLSHLDRRDFFDTTIEQKEKISINR